MEEMRYIVTGWLVDTYPSGMLLSATAAPEVVMIASSSGMADKDEIAGSTSTIKNY